jgi:hypothetical protein
MYVFICHSDNVGFVRLDLTTHTTREIITRIACHHRIYPLITVLDSSVTSNAQAAAVVAVAFVRLPVLTICNMYVMIMLEHLCTGHNIRKRIRLYVADEH